MLSNLFNRRVGPDLICVSGKPRNVVEMPQEILKSKVSSDLLQSKLEDARFVVLDTELTGLKLRKDSIVSIGALRMAGGRIFLGDYFYRIVNPRTSLTGSSVVIHEITPSEASECPDIKVFLPELVEYCRDCIIVGHVVSIDLGFINKELKSHFSASLRNPAVDTLSIYRWLEAKKQNACAYHESRPENTTLRSISKKYGISGGKSHNAIEDAYLTAQLFQRLLAELPEYGIRTAADLVRIGKP
jgi:DNA polymerase-3 subunit epsilon